MSIPVNREMVSQMDILARSREDRGQKIPPPYILAQGSIVADANDHPHVLYVSHLEKPGQVIHATADAAGRWHQEPIDVIAKAYRKFRPASCRGSLTITEDGVAHVFGAHVVYCGQTVITAILTDAAAAPMESAREHRAVEDALATLSSTLGSAVEAFADALS